MAEPSFTIRASVYTKSVVKDGLGRIVVEASNGKPEGPPFVRFEIPPSWDPATIDKRYIVTIEQVER